MVQLNGRASITRFRTCVARYIQLLLVLFGSVFSSPTFAQERSYLDQTFAGNGVAKIIFGAGKSWGNGGAIDSDGKIVVAGSVNYEGYLHSIALARVHANGMMDDKFGDKGIVVTKVGVNSRSTAIALTLDGKIVVVGWAFVEKGKEGITVAKYNADGSLDSSFAEQGLLIFPNEYSTAYAHSMAVQPDGKILIGGMIRIRKEYKDQLILRSVPHDYVFLTRVNQNGSLDTTFGMKGTVQTDVGGGELRITSLTLQQDGKVIAAGSWQKGSTSTLVLARYNMDGSLDQRFGAQGLVSKTSEKVRYKTPTVVMLADGRIQVFNGYALQDDAWLLISTLREDGTFDLNFGDKGTITTRTEFWRYSEFITLSQLDGKILVSGLSLRPPKPGQSRPPFHYSIGVSRFLQDGQADKSFGPSGMRVVPVGSMTDKPVFATIQADGRIVVVGQSDNQDAQHIVLIGLVP